VYCWTSHQTRIGSDLVLLDPLLLSLSRGMLLGCLWCISCSVRSRGVAHLHALEFASHLAGPTVLRAMGLVASGFLMY